MSDNTTTCHFCKSEIGDGAERCTTCKLLQPPRPTHGGTCPACRSSIDAEAVVCPGCSTRFGFSLADPTLQELWEVYRMGQKGVQEYPAFTVWGDCTRFGVQFGVRYTAWGTMTLVARPCDPFGLSNLFPKVKITGLGSDGD